jgi:membrane fusion protein (multidrug efflux system)
VAVTKGLSPGQTVVSTGVFKYRNGQSVVVDNTLAPEFNLSPSPENS